MLSREQSIQVCRLIAGLVVTDDDLDEKEDAFIEKMLAGFGIPLADRDFIFPIIDAAEASAALKEMPKDVQAEAVDLLVRAAAADGKLAPEERAYLVAVADAVGMAQEEMERRVGDRLAESAAR